MKQPSASSQSLCYNFYFYQSELPISSTFVIAKKQAKLNIISSIRELKSAEARRAENTNRNMEFFQMQMGLMKGNLSVTDSFAIK